VFECGDEAALLPTLHATNAKHIQQQHEQPSQQQQRHCKQKHYSQINRDSSSLYPTVVAGI